MSSPTINDMMSAYAEDAVDFARNRFSVSLDYTVESVEQVERIAEQLFDSTPRTFLTKLFRKTLTADELDQVCKMLGGYMGEVYRRAKGGDWGIHQELQAIGVCRGEAWIFPPAKVHKRLANGAEDNLWSYFRVMVEEPFSH